MKKVAVCLALATMFCASSSFAQELYKKLNGTWVSDTFTVEIDTDKGTYSGVAFGDLFDRKITFVKEMANVVVFQSDGTQIVAQFQEDGDLLLTKKGGFPALVKRQKK